jgi:hypothetical protein
VFFGTFWGTIYWVFDALGGNKTANQKVEEAVPMSPSQRRAIKEFIMKKEAAELGEYSGQLSERDEILETGAVDCLYGVHALYQKLLSSEQDALYEKDTGFTIIEAVSAAGWLAAMQRKDGQTMDAEEARIARILFDAADLDSAHTITFTEFAMLAVLLSATDASDADAQVGYCCCARDACALQSVAPAAVLPAIDASRTATG